MTLEETWEIYHKLEHKVGDVVLIIEKNIFAIIKSIKIDKHKSQIRYGIQVELKFNWYAEDQIIQ